MITWFWIFALVFVSLLVTASIKSYKRKRTPDEFMLAGRGVTSVLGFLTYSAALFSAFTFMGMPDFFRVHGIGSWIFLAIANGAKVFFILWFGYQIRKKVSEVGFRGVAGMISGAYGIKHAGLLVFASAFIFLIPYVAIQIRGISIFFSATFPHALPAWGWAMVIVIFMMIYSGIGGLKAIIYSDAIQGLVLLTVIWVIGISCVATFGSLANMFGEVEKLEPALLSVPGPNRLFTVQFLVASFLSIVFLPVTQPQFSTRIVVLKDLRALHRMAIGVGVFSILVILPTAFIGMYGAVNYAGSPTDIFLSGTLLRDQKSAVAALAIVGLFAAVLSTTNAQIFALGSELRSILSGSERQNLYAAKTAMFLFAVIVLVFSTMMSDQLVLLARTSFTGTSFMAPVILAGILSRRKAPGVLLWFSGMAILIYLGSLFHLWPDEYFGFRLDLLIYIVLGISSLLTWMAVKLKNGKTGNSVE